MSDVKKGLGEVKSMSIEAKAAILGTIYALERMMSASAQRGTDLTNFAQSIGMSSQMLERYQYAASRVGATNEEVAGTFKSLQDNITKTLRGEGSPSGLGRINSVVGGLSTRSDLEKMVQHPELLLQKLQDYAQKQKNLVWRNADLNSMGVTGQNMVTALVEGKFNAKTLAQAPVNSDRENKSLRNAQVGLRDFNDHIERSFQRLTAAYGPKMIADLTKLSDAFFKLAEALAKFSNEQGAMKLFSTAIDGLARLFQLLNGDVDQATKKGKGQKTFGQGTWWMNGLEKGFDGILNMKEKMQELDQNMNQSITPKIPTSPGGTGAQNVNVQQNLHFQHPGTEHNRTADSVRVAINSAVRQMPSLVQVG